MASPQSPLEQHRRRDAPKKTEERAGGDGDLRFQARASRPSELRTFEV